ncbi:MAG: PAS domain S-box protein [Deltaproteobacteria bacterium]|nr:PAS domain S-box protein [Deltaproteobacteria bacterium]
MTPTLLLRLKNHLEDFLEIWPRRMAEAGYLQQTTARRHDCVQAYYGVLTPIWELASSFQSWSFGRLIQSDLEVGGFLVAESQRHLNRGVTLEQFLGCFKTVIHSLEEIIDHMDADEAEKKVAINWLRQYHDAGECAVAAAWVQVDSHEMMERLRRGNRRLTLEKNKFENIFQATNDLVMIADRNGLLAEANAAALCWFRLPQIVGWPFWKILGLEGHDLEEVLKFYPPYLTHEMTLFDELQPQFYHLQIIPLTSVALGNRGYVLMLTNTSCMVAQRERLEKRLRASNQALMNSEKLFGTLFQSAGDAILLVDPDLKILEANRRACELFQYSPEALSGMDCRNVAAPGAMATLDGAIKGLDEDEIWTGEVNGRKKNGQSMPLQLTINRVELDKGSIFHIVLRDITAQKRLEESLRREKHQTEEMNITLKNVLKTIDREREEMEGAISQNIETVLLPALERVRAEDEDHVRDSYLKLIKKQLIGLTAGTSRGLDERMLKLTRTELQICQYVQAGLSSKQIAEAMNLAADTVHTHRRNIRKKLGIRGREVNLYSFLNTSQQGAVARV